MNQTVHKQLSPPMELSLEEIERQLEIRRQIALLQEKKVDIPGLENLPSSPKKKNAEDPGTMLAPATPSPKKKRKLDSMSAPVASSSTLNTSRRTEERAFAKPAPSKLLSNLTKLHSLTSMKGATESVQRSSAFTDRPCPRPDLTQDSSTAPKRDDRLALIEDLEPGPVDYKPPFDDPAFETLEPNSGINLLSRSIPHEDLQEHLTGRYYLSPSQLYSSIRLLPDKQGYDVPVPGAWITIAVVAERGPLRYMKPPAAAGEDEDPKKKGKEKAKQESKPAGRKYVNMKLIDFGSRSKSSATGGKAVIRGDAFLSLLLFEAESFDVIKDERGKPHKLYKGGSRGAFESLAKVKEGDVIALLNPRILKPFQRSAENPHPQNNILAVTPESTTSIMVIGRSKDLGMCKAIRRDGKKCESWCDKRVSDVCDWHLQNAVQKSRAGRPEFSASTSGLSTTAKGKKQVPEFDPARQWGLKPEDSGGGATYVVSGQVVRSSASSLFVAENVGREGQARAQRKLAKAEDRTLKALLERDKEGTRAMMAAREAAEKSAKGKKAEKKRKAEDEKNGRGSEEPATKRHAYSATTIRHLGFDPVAVRNGGPREDEAEAQKKLRDLTAARSRRHIQLGRRPGEKVRSGVILPEKLKDETNLESGEERSMVDLDD